MTISMRLRRAVVAGAAAACQAIAGCAGRAAFGEPRPGAAHTPAGEAVAPQAALAAVVTGRSTRADVEAALGRAIAVSFDSGYEAWVYRWPGHDAAVRSATELVVLFAPSGVAANARLRAGEAGR